MIRAEWKKRLTLLAAGMMSGMLLGCGTDAASGQEEKDSSTETVTEAEKTEQSGQKTDDPFGTIADSYYIYSYTVEGYGQYDYFFHFYDEVPVLGSVFYAGFANNQQNFAGTYEVVEEPYDYECAESWQKLVDEEKETGTAPYTIIFYDWDGTELDRCGYDGNAIYNMMTEVAGVGSNEVIYTHDTDGEQSKYEKTYEAEAGVPYLDFVAEEDGASTLTLFHNGTYLDLIGTIIEGSWSMEEGADGGYTYTLTPELSTDTGAVLDVSAGKDTAVYTPENGDAVALKQNAEQESSSEEGQEKEVLFSFTGGFCTFDILKDHTYAFAFEDYGIEEEGTWNFDPSTYVFTITQSNGKEIQAQLTEDYSLTFDYTSVTSDALTDTFTANAQTWGVLTQQ